MFFLSYFPIITYLLSRQLYNNNNKQQYFSQPLNICNFWIKLLKKKQKKNRCMFKNTKINAIFQTKKILIIFIVTYQFLYWGSKLLHFIIIQFSARAYYRLLWYDDCNVSQGTSNITTNNKLVCTFSILCLKMLFVTSWVKL